MNVVPASTLSGERKTGNVYDKRTEPYGKETGTKGTENEKFGVESVKKGSFGRDRNDKEG